MADDLQLFLNEIRQCRLCEADMVRVPNPIVQAQASARILVAGQAPGNLADRSSRPFTDPSGDRLRDWMGITPEDFYDASRVAIAPMGFCFPGYDAKGGDLPPLKRCAEHWRAALMERLPKVELVLAVGGYAQAWHLGEAKQQTLTATVENWRFHLAKGILPTPHPSWRNNGWLRKNPWFAEELLPELKRRVKALL